MDAEQEKKEEGEEEEGEEKKEDGVVDEEEEDPEEKEAEDNIPPKLLTQSDINEGISLLCKVGTGLAHAFVRRESVSFSYAGIIIK